MTVFTKPDLSKPVSKTDWLLVEQYYHTELGKIYIPEDPKPFDITQINSQLDKLYHEVRLDLFYATHAFDNIASAYKKLKRALWPIVKAGKNAEERDHLMQDYLLMTTLDKFDEHILKSFGLPSVPISIYVMYESYKERAGFLKAISDIISDKTGRLITDSGAMKIESRLGS